MKHKVLLADDSLTIQKVIKITLANQPYEIVEASSEEELFKKLNETNPKIVFLDFNLSEKYTGFELTSKIRASLPSTKVLLLLGTFDSVDDSALEKCGASEKVVKPFDSNKFIAICNRLVDDEEFEEDDFLIEEDQSSSIELPKKVSELALEEQWQMSDSTPRNLEQAIEEKKAILPSLNALNKEISDWGMSVPSVIDGEPTKDKLIGLPPIIGDVKSLNEQKAKTEKKNAVLKEKESSKYDVKFPEEDDLDYPSLGEVEKVSSDAPEGSKGKSEAKASKLISIDTFSDVPSELELEGPYVEDVADIKKIEEQIRDEVEADLWQVDEFEDLKKEVSTKIGEMKGDFQPGHRDFDESLFRPLDEIETNRWKETSAMGLDDLRGEIEGMVKKYVKEYMDEIFQKNVEKISWEVIPDLAENLIRKELSNISNKILGDQG